MGIDIYLAVKSTNISVDYLFPVVTRPGSCKGRMCLSRLRARLRARLRVLLRAAETRHDRADPTSTAPQHAQHEQRACAHSAPGGRPSERGPAGQEIALLLLVLVLFLLRADKLAASPVREDHFSRSRASTANSHSSSR